MDGQLFGAYFGDGLVYPQTREDVGGEAISRAYVQVNEYLGHQFGHLEDPLWSFAPDSREWDKLRAVLLNAALIHLIGEDMAELRIGEAEKLLQFIAAWQGS